MTVAQPPWPPASDVMGGTILVVPQWTEDSTWLLDQPFKYVLVSKGYPQGTPNNVPFNKAKEADCYIQFIVEHYDDLPPRMIFVHNHPHSWHLSPVRTSGVCCMPALH
jgi:hypothetical protein